MARCSAKAQPYFVESEEERIARLTASASRVRFGDPAARKLVRYQHQILNYLIEKFGASNFEIVVEGIQTVNHTYVVVVHAPYSYPRWTVFIGEKWRIRDRESYLPVPREIIRVTEGHLTYIAICSYGPIVIDLSGQITTRVQGHELIPVGQLYTPDLPSIRQL